MNARYAVLDDAARLARAYVDVLATRPVDASADAVPAAFAAERREGGVGV